MDIKLDEAVKDFRVSTLRETDYIEEAHFAHELYGAYKHNPDFVIPETFLDLCTKHIIVQEYIDGLSVAQLVKLQTQGVDPKTYVKEVTGSDLDQQMIVLGFESLNGIFNLPRIQGDPHPGNIRLLRDNKVGLIDFGISARTPRDRAAFFGLLEEWNRLYDNSENIVKLFEQFMRFFVSDLYQALRKLGTLSKNQQTQANFTNEVGQVAQETFSKVLGQGDIKPLLEDGRALQIINQMVNKNNRFGLVMRFEASEILRACQTYMTLVESLGRRKVVLPQVFKLIVEQVRRDHPEFSHQLDEGMTMADAMETVSNWLERVAERDPVLFRQLMTRIKLKEGQAPVEASS